MPAENYRHKRWKLSHDPDARPLGCNGKYGDSGRNLHSRKGEPVCAKCKASSNHAKRERNRGQKMPRFVHPCGTPAAARRHRFNGEALCIPCQIAEAAHHAELRAKNP